MSLRVGIVGLGAMGRTHLRAVQSLPEVVVVAGADVSPAALGSAGPLETYADPLALVGQADVDAVLVASSDASHAAVVLACLDRELPVLCEKPLTTTVEDAERIVAREVSLGRRLVQVGFMRRFDPAFASVAAAVYAGTVGPPAVVHTVHRNPSSAYAFEPSVLVRNSASHDVDLVRWMTGSEVAEVTCTWVAGADADFASALLRLRTHSGVLATAELTYGPGLAYDVRCEVVGRRGAVTTPGAIPAPGADWMDRFAQAYAVQDAQWVDAVRAGQPVGASAWDGLANVVVLAAAERASTTGTPVAVLVPDRPDLYR